MSSPNQTDEGKADDVEFVSEGPLRPQVECVDLLSDSEDEGCSSRTGMIEDDVSRHKAHVASTLDRLAQQVAREKQERADKCKAFKEKQNSQRAHGMQELASCSTHGTNQEAKRCVDMWLKMPGAYTGRIHSGSQGRHGPFFSSNMSFKYKCPVINCGRVYDHVSLLDGHLKRFDHSPCDPTITLKGCSDERFACVACYRHFQTHDEWRRHLEYMVSSPDAGGHSINQTCHQIVCFACPDCYLLFNLRDECLQHMSAQNHVTESLSMTEHKGRLVAPIPVPHHAKNHLTALCKDVPFNVQCNMCHAVLTSHQTAQAHFNVHCRRGSAVAKAKKTVVQVMKELQVQGQCSVCCEIFFSEFEMTCHQVSTQHDVEINQGMDQALLQYSRFHEIQQTKKAKEAQVKRQSSTIESSFQRRRKGSESKQFPMKRQKKSPSTKSHSQGSITTRYCCECGLKFSEEGTAIKHLLAVNQICHQCGVCGKHMGESSIARLHMSRFHGGAHLSNLLFYCRKCNVEMPRYEDILSHVSEVHKGHNYIFEQEVPQDVVLTPDAKPCTSSQSCLHSTFKPGVQPATASHEQAQNWMCRMCEEIFDSESAVHKHCSDVSSHSFQRFMCGHCPQKFFKESTVRRHCANEHNGQIKSSHFCGLCDSMPFETECEFLEHYKSLHSRDYYSMDDVEVVQPPVAETISHASSCPCMGSEKSKIEMKATFTQCMRNLASEGKCQYVCSLCDMSVPSYAQIKTHVHTKHTALIIDKMFEVECKTCLERFMDVPSFHKHHHSRHCMLEPCVSSRTFQEVEKSESTTAILIDAVEIKAETNEIQDEASMLFLGMEKTKKDSDENQNDTDEEMNCTLAISAEEEQESADVEEALQRSLVEF